MQIMGEIQTGRRANKQSQIFLRSIHGKINLRNTYIKAIAAVSLMKFSLVDDNGSNTNIRGDIFTVHYLDKNTCVREIECLMVH